MNPAALRIPALLATLTVLFITAGACKDSTTAPGNDIIFPDKNVSYAAQVQPLFTLRCATYGCHDDQSRKGNLSLTSYWALKSRVGMVIAGDADASVLMQTLDGRLPHPYDAPLLVTQNQINGIRTWINEGAKDN